MSDSHKQFENLVGPSESMRVMESLKRGASRRDVLTLAHELGHGLHQTLAGKQGIFHQDTPLTVAETASVFAEELVFGRLLEAEKDPASRLGLLSEAVEGQIGHVLRVRCTPRDQRATAFSITTSSLGTSS